MDQIIQELIALTLTRRDWQGIPYYQENILPLEILLNQKLEDLHLPLKVCWDFEAKEYGLFPQM